MGLERQLEQWSEKLQPCPFCGGRAEFVKDKSNHLVIQHIPESGVNCPARFYQVCDTNVIGMNWWNTPRRKIEDSEKQ